MKDALIRLFVMLQVLKEERGQDLVEYAFVTAVIALGASAGMSTLVTSINSVFTKVSSTLASHL